MQPNDTNIPRNDEARILMRRLVKSHERIIWTGRSDFRRRVITGAWTGLKSAVRSRQFVLLIIVLLIVGLIPHGLEYLKPIGITAAVIAALLSTAFLFSLPLLYSASKSTYYGLTPERIIIATENTEPSTESYFPEDLAEPKCNLYADGSGDIVIGRKRVMNEENRPKMVDILLVGVKDASSVATLIHDTLLSSKTTQ